MSNPAFIFAPLTCALVHTSFNTPARSSTRASRFALRAAHAGAAICLRAVAKPMASANKTDCTPVTAADYAAQVRIAALLRDMLPGDVLIAEESLEGFNSLPASIRDDVCSLARMPSSAVRDTLSLCMGPDKLVLDCSRVCGRVWTCDPVDGSAGLKASKSYAVGIARLSLVPHLPPDTAALALPHHHSILLADQCGMRVYPVRLLGERAAINHTSRRRPWHFSPAAKTVPFPELPPATTLCCGSLIKYGEVALGNSDALVQFLPSGRAHVHDHAAGIAAVLASGGRVTDLDGCSLLSFDNCFVSVNTRRGVGGIVASGQGVDHTLYCSAARRALCS
jgi:3'-phosphoadenosine 5'-phosphosulfate (PAPS) 3'-phosphatase